MTSKRLKITLTAYLLLLPSLVFLSLFTLYPIVRTVYNSLFHMKLGMAPRFAGLDNYRTMWNDPVFWKVMRNTFIFAIGTIPVCIALALIMAVFVNQSVWGKGFLRTIYFYPTVIPAIAAASIWLFIYTPKYGLLSLFASKLNLPSYNWLGDPNIVLWATMVMVVWKEAGYYMIFYLAGLQNIPKELYEAAEVDGAKPTYVFFRITFPLLMPTTLFILILSTTHGFRFVDHLPIMTKGGPDNASNLLLYYIYETAFTAWNNGMAATLSVVLIAILLFFACFQFFGLDKKIHYG